MRKRTWVIGSLVAAGALGVGGLIAASPAVADVGPLARHGVAVTSPGPGAGPGAERGTGRGPGPGAGRGDGSCLAVTAAKGTLTDAQQATLAALTQEEKLAHDLYQAFAARYPSAIFDRIAAAEARHLDAARTLLERYGVTDPTEGKAAGQFSDSAVQATYDKLFKQGTTDEKAALGVGVGVEQRDIGDLEKADDGLSAPDVQQVYQHLLAASRQHLAAFQNWSAS